MKQGKLSVIGIVLAVTVLLLTLVFEVDLFEAFIEAIHKFEHFEVDEVIIPLGVFCAFAFIDLFLSRNEHKNEIEKVEIYKAMVSSTDHILNNFLNQMILFKMTAEDTEEFDPKILALYEKTIRDTSTQVRALGSLTKVSPEAIKKASLDSISTSETDSV